MKEFVLNLKDVELFNVGGDFCFYDLKTGKVIVPYVEDFKSFDLSIDLIDDFVVSGDFIGLVYDNKAVVIDVFNGEIYSYTSAYPTVGIVSIGDLFAFFTTRSVVFFNKRSKDFKEVVLNFNGVPLEIEDVKQISPYVFAFITKYPTTLFVESLLSLADIYEFERDYNYSGVSFAVFNIPTRDVELFLINDDLIILGEDGTVFCELEAKDTVYIRTTGFVNYRKNTYDLVKETLKLNSLFVDYTNYGIVRLKNNFGQQYYLDTFSGMVYLAQKTIPLGFRFVYDEKLKKLYKISFEFRGSLNEPILAQFQVKHFLHHYTVLRQLFVRCDEALYGEYDLEILTKYFDAERGFHYRMNVNRNLYKFNLRGDTFLYNFIFKAPIMIAEVQFGYSS